MTISRLYAIYLLVAVISHVFVVVAINTNDSNPVLWYCYVTTPCIETVQSTKHMLTSLAYFNYQSLTINSMERKTRTRVVE